MNQPTHNTFLQANQQVNGILAILGQHLLGKPEVIRLSLAGLLARGHLLLEDVPGVGKTTLAHALATTLGLHYQRVQFTSDLLPADLIGVSVYLRDTGRFEFHRGPLFSQVLLADEINRASPKTQSALLEAMAERQVTHDGETHTLPDPFFVIATQNPQSQIGTHALPESQLDRFMMRLSIGYPDAQAEKALYLGGANTKATTAHLSATDVFALQQLVDDVQVSEALAAYVLALVAATREPRRFLHGLSPRGGLALIQAGKAWAFLEGRHFVIPEDIQKIFTAVAGHRLMPGSDLDTCAPVMLQLLQEVAIP
ncbi:AAA family ATPase [Leeia oryzae]|uniref:AAA family ATPase n=1 Tax=Leeia oryzae TaxID=356662 RepID=UPI0003661A0D|nr:MoxR family ATPase [Leeia oryzae]